MRVTAFRREGLALGTWLSLGSPVVAELAAECGFDWLLFDLEHGCLAEGGLLANLQAVRGGSSCPIVRVGSTSAPEIGRALDWGAGGIMVPHVSSAETARACVRAMHYPPRGERGYSRSVRAQGYGLQATDERAPDPPLLVQIETWEAVANVREIAAVEGVDVLFVGPADLQLDLRCQRGDVPSFADCLARVAEAAREAGKDAGLLVRNEEDLPSVRDLAFRVLAIDSDLAILRRGWQRLRSFQA